MKIIIAANSPHSIADKTLIGAIFAIVCEPFSPMIDL
jgi:hypothetical protein